ncbi:hypothetical protein HDV02_001588 [Globomyces sp. JEL0801]|nr:hypothetical protein HDV02_001588 [Globomyces sp. JEL0801]
MPTRWLSVQEYSTFGKGVTETGGNGGKRFTVINNLKLIVSVDGVVGRKNWIHGNHKKRLISVTDPTDAITCFKCDVDKIIIGTRNRNLSLYNTQSTEVWDKPAIKPEMMFLEVHHSPILCIDYQTPVGHLLTSADALGTLGIWNLYTGELLALHKKAHDKGISCVSIIDSNYIISAGFDKVVRLFKVDEQLAKPAELFQADSKHSISSTNQSKRFSKPSFFKRLFKKNKSPKHHLKCKLTLKKEFRGHKGEIYCMRVLSTRTHFATGATDFQIKIKTVECEKTLRGHTNTITCDLLYSGSLDCAIRCWSTSTGQCLSVFVGHSEWVKSIAISGKLLVSGGWDESVLLWNRENSTLVKKIRLDMGPISNIQCSETKVILACREEGFQHQLTILDFGRNSVGFWGDHKTL